jgi:hypothetical protein
MIILISFFRDRSLDSSTFLLEKWIMQKPLNASQVLGKIEQ